MPKLTNRSPLTERLNLRVSPELMHAIHRVTAPKKVEPTDWAREVLEAATKRELGEAA